jgi:toxin YoeB
MKVAFHATAWAHYLHWQANDPKTLARVSALIEDIRRSPFRGLGKPEPLRENLTGWWSRRISDEHRLVYRVAGSGEGQHIEILSCRHHYSR